MDAILTNFAFFGDLITKEDLEETYRTLYFFESPLYVGYGKNTENTPNSVCNDILLGGFFIVQKILRPIIPPISGSETYRLGVRYTSSNGAATGVEIAG